jgi:pimeloyl-ACP methyl ester carboxylesterase
MRTRIRIKSLLQKLIVASIAIVVAFGLISQIVALWIEARIPRDGTLIMIDGANLHYLERGEGRPIVMIHGLLGQMRNFAPELIDRLAANHRVILIDRPGSGYSAPLADGTNTLSGQADVVAGLITALDLDAPLIVGHSLGGAVALKLALDHPNHVGALALIAPVTQSRESASAAFKAISIPSDSLRLFVSMTFATPVGLMIFETSAKVIFSPEAMPAGFVTKGGSLLSIRPMNYFAAGGDMVALHNALPDMVTRYPFLKIPVGILFGSQDQVLDPVQHGVPLRDAVSGATLTQIEGGHMIVYTTPDPVSDWILGLAKQLEQKSDLQ